MVKIQTKDGEEEAIVKGFLARPVFRYEDTAGQPITHAIPELPDLPLLDKAKEWGISVEAIPGNYQYYGYFSKAAKEIALATREESVFFHELAHAAHGKIKGDGKMSRWSEEIVAELSAAALCRIVGKSSKHLGNNYRYIKKYAKDARLSPIKACLKVLHEVEATLNPILATPS